MEDSKAFKSVLDVTKTICEFIAGEHYSVFRRITWATFGVSVSFVSVRIFEKTPDLEKLEERTGALFDTLAQGGVKTLTINVFSAGIKYILRYDDKGKDLSQRPENTPDGFLFLADLGGKKDAPLKDPNLFGSVVGPWLAPLLDESAAGRIFLNGQALPEDYL